MKKDSDMINRAKSYSPEEFAQFREIIEPIRKINPNLEFEFDDLEFLFADMLIRLNRNRRNEAGLRSNLALVQAEFEDTRSKDAARINHLKSKISKQKKALAQMQDQGKKSLFSEKKL